MSKPSLAKASSHSATILETQTHSRETRGLNRTEAFRSLNCCVTWTVFFASSLSLERDDVGNGPSQGNQRPMPMLGAKACLDAETRLAVQSGMIERAVCSSTALHGHEIEKRSHLHSVNNVLF